MRVLLVEDNEALAENLSEIFRDAGYQVMRASDGASAMAIAAGGFDLALLDVRLPDGLGTSLLPALKEAVPDAEVIVTTGNADIESAVQAVRGGAFAYLTKPVAIEELLRTAARAVERVELHRLSRELQSALQVSERRHRDILEGVQAMIFAVDRDLTIRFANRAVEEVTGWKREELLGRNQMETFSPPAERPERSAKALAAFDGSSEQYEVDFLCKDGSKRRVQLRWSRPVTGAEDLIYGMGLDVTRQRQLEREARVSEKLAAVGTLATGLAHEIRNPLNAAGLQLSLLARRVAKVKPEERRPLEEPLSLVRAELARLEGLLADFLAFARPRGFTRFPVDLSELTGRVAILEGEEARAAGKSLQVVAEAGVIVSGDGAGLHQVLVNLVKNALDAAQGEVQVTLARAGGKAVLCVDDDGPGIRPEVMARLFEPFFTTKPEGTGLGLAIIHTIVGSHGGEVGLELRAGGGTRARVALPLSE